MAQKVKSRRPRGSNPPMLSLQEAIGIITRLYEDVGGEASYDTLGRILDNSQSSSTFIKKLGTLKNYGLIADENRLVRVSEIGRGIVAPTAPSELAASKKRAFLNIEVFAFLYEKYKGKLLPQDEFLTNVVVEAVPREFAEKWIDRFKQSAKAAGLIRERGDGKLQVQETADAATDSISQYQEESVREEQPSPHLPTRPREEPESEPVSYGHVSKIKLSEGRQAVFSLPDRLTARDAQKLKGALQGLATIIESMTDEDSATKGITDDN